MKNRIQHKMEMYLSVARVVDEHRDSWSSLSAFALMRTIFIDKMEKLKEQLDSVSFKMDGSTSLMIAQIDVLLTDQMDLLVSILKPTEMSFYKAYFNARTLADSNSREFPPEGNFGESAA